MKEFIVTDDNSVYELLFIHILRNTHIEKLVINEKVNFHNFMNKYKLTELSKIKRLNIDAIDCSKVTTLDGFFSHMVSLESTPKFINTENVVSVSGMFAHCSNLVDVKLFDTSSVDNFSSMFVYCTELESVPEFNTSEALDMSFMFAYCHSLETAPNLKTDKVRNFRRMFSYCSSLKSIPNYDMSCASNISEMLSGCYSLEVKPYFKFRDEKQIFKIMFINSPNR